jgi:hypothetical protein
MLDTEVLILFGFIKESGKLSVWSYTHNRTPHGGRLTFRMREPTQMSKGKELVAR